MMNTLPEARNRLANAQYEDKHDVYKTSSEMMVDSWSEFWITNLYDVLKSCYEERHTRKESELLSQILGYVDRRTDQTQYLCMKDLVFINFRTGEPAKKVRARHRSNKLKIGAQLVRSASPPQIRKTIENKGVLKYMKLGIVG